MSCILKIVPPAQLTFQNTGNRGGNFPLVSNCGTVEQPTLSSIFVPPEECYFVRQEDGLTSIDLETDSATEFGDFLISAPCV